MARDLHKFPLSPIVRDKAEQRGIPMKRLTQLAGALLVAATLTLLTPATSDAAPRHYRGGYYGGYHYHPYYGGYRGFYGGYYRPYAYGGFYRPYYYGGWRGYGYSPYYAGYY